MGLDKVYQFDIIIIYLYEQQIPYLSSSRKIKTET